MQCVANYADHGHVVFWCSRCGTLKTQGKRPDSEAPKLVQRVRALREETKQIVVFLGRLGIDEAIGAPPVQPCN